MSEIKRLPGETKEDAKLRAQKEWQAQAEAGKRVLDQAKRKLYTTWFFWKFCPHKQCRRQRGCAGDLPRCHKRFWHAVPEDIKVQFRAYVTASARDKLPRHEALRHAREERARYLAMEARFAQDRVKAAEAAKPAETVRFVPENRAPRVRSW